jgi:hypothetical protein
MSAPNVTIRPLRDYSQHEVISFYRYNPTGDYPTFKGTFVKVWSGASPSDTVNDLGSVGTQFGNVVSDRYGVQPYVVDTIASGDSCLGVLLYDIREVDENGEKLILHPAKMERMQAVLSGWPVPILRRGLITYSGLEVNVAPVGGENAYLSPGQVGTITTSGAAGVSTKVGKFLGPKDSNGWVYVWLDVT